MKNLLRFQLKKTEKSDIRMDGKVKTRHHMLHWRGYPIHFVHKYIDDVALLFTREWHYRVNTHTNLEHQPQQNHHRCTGNNVCMILDNKLMAENRWILRASTTPPNRHFFGLFMAQIETLHDVRARCTHSLELSILRFWRVLGNSGNSR